MARLRFRQNGVVLVIGLIMLVLLTLMVVSAINSGTANLRIAGNMQAQDEARTQHLALPRKSLHQSLLGSMTPGSR
jgi:Tfp pilus assembly protein PilX